MSHTPSLRLRLLPAFAGVMLLLGAMSAAARAASYGELGHFGKGAGNGLGRLFWAASSRVGDLSQGRGRGASVLRVQGALHEPGSASRRRDVLCVAVGDGVGCEEYECACAA
jgi:hypothetical protein